MARKKSKQVGNNEQGPPEANHSTSRTAVVQESNSSLSFNDWVLPEYSYWVISALFVVAYFLFSRLSNGFYQHDEVGHFLNMQSFWKDPSTILGVWQKPGFKLIYAIPALFGSTGVLLFNCILTAAMCYVATLIAKEYQIKNRILSLVFCGFQPFLYQLSFRNYSELLTGLLLGLMVLMYIKNRYILTALIASYLFSMRQELALIAVMLGMVFLYKRQFVAFVCLAWTPIVLNILGFIKTGDPLWVIHQLTETSSRYNYKQVGFFHYWKMFTPTIGTVISAFFLVGYFSFIPLKNQWKEQIKKYHFIYLVFTVYFLMYCLFVSEWFTFINVYGILRTLIVVSPLIAVFANLGFNRTFTESKNYNRYAFITLVIYSGLVLAFLSYQYDHTHFTDIKDTSKIVVMMLLGGIIALVYQFKVPLKAGIVMTCLLAVFHTVYTEKPFKLSPEDSTVKQTIDYYLTNNLKDRKTIMNHALLYYYAKAPHKTNENFVLIEKEALENAPIGSICIFDTHYGTKNGVKLEDIRNNKDYKLIQNFIAPDRTFAAYVFEKQGS